MTRPFAEEEAIRPEIVRVALAHGIASRFTAFVAVERSRRVDGTMVEVVQPVPVPDQWAADFTVISSPADITFMSSPPMMTYASPAPRAMRRSAMPPAAPMMHLADLADDLIMASDVNAAPSRKRKGESADGGDVCGTLARQQRADGSFDGDVRKTAAALVALVQAGHTRISGDRRRTVLKAATWLASRSEAAALAALRVLDTVENGGSFPGIPPEIGDLGELGLAGRMLGSATPG